MAHTVRVPTQTFGRARRYAFVLVVALVVAAAAACSSTSSGNPSGPGGSSNDSGSLAVTITAPGGVVAAVSVTGPSGYRKVVRTTQTIAHLAPGSYTINAIAGETSDPIVGTPYEATVAGSPAVVTANATANTTVTYVQRASRGLLWVSNLASLNAVGYSSAQLSASGSPTPGQSVDIGGPANLAVDNTGGVWVSAFNSDTIHYYTEAQLLAGGTPRPKLVISPTNGSLRGVTDIALDAKGDLWASSQYTNTVVEFTPDQMASGGALTPGITITAAFGAISRPFALTFDAKGNLWVASINDSLIAGYSPAALSASGEPVPFASVTRSVPVALAFDSAGDLWVASLGNVAEFTPTQLTSIASPTPAVVLTLQHSGNPQAIAFDDGGDMWVADQTNNTVLKYAPSQLTATGSPTPDAIIAASANSLNAPAGIAFSPHPIAVPLN